MDKHFDRVPAMEREIGHLKGYLIALKKELRSADERDLLKAVEKEVEEEQEDKDSRVKYGKCRYSSKIFIVEIKIEKEDLDHCCVYKQQQYGA